MSEPTFKNPVPDAIPNPIARSVGLYLGCALLIALVVVFDLNTDPEFSMSVFYLVPVALAAWYGGRGAGVAFSVASAIAWYLEDATEHHYTHAGAAFWEGAVRLATSLLVTVLLSRLRTSLRTEQAEKAKVAGLNAELERRVEERTCALESHLRELEEFTYTMAHDLGTPVRAVRGFADLLLLDFEEALGDAGVDYLDRIFRAAERMDRLVQDLLNYSRLMVRPVTLERVELRPLVLEVNSSMSEEFARRDAEVISEVPPLPVRGERGLLTVTLRCLVSNALEDVEDEKRPRIEIRGHRHEDRVRIQFWDNGRGIPPEQWARLFRPGQRHYPGAWGTGMALAIARKAAERMGGLAGTESVDGKGNCVWIELPAA
jgi:signal transduction histidine kinase